MSSCLSSCPCPPSHWLSFRLACAQDFPLSAGVDDPGAKRPCCFSGFSTYPRQHNNHSPYHLLATTGDSLSDHRTIHPQTGGEDHTMAASTMSAQPQSSVFPKAHVGFDSITSQIEKKLLKRGFQFNVICVGMSLGPRAVLKTRPIDAHTNARLQARLVSANRL